MKINLVNVILMGTVIGLLSGCGMLEKDFRGSPGATGQSIQGPQGNVGATGGVGQIGPEGVSGAAGTNGTSCSVSSLAVGSVVAPNGGSLITCSDGTSSVVLNGSQGSAGETGSQGVAGTPGTVITPVQFCPNITPTYPSSFPESGLCIDGSIWAVYSVNGGFLAALPNGEYSSDGVNASCTFYINGCSVTY